MTVSVIAVGALVLIVLLYLLSRLNPGVDGVTPALVTWASPERAASRIPELRAWEAEVLAARTGGTRGRARLGRRLEPLVVAALRDRHGLSLADPAATELLGAEWVYLRGGPVPPDRPGLMIDDAVTSVLDRLVETSSRGGA